MKTLKTIRSRYTAIFAGLSLVFLAVVFSSYLSVNYLQQSTGQYTKVAALVHNADRNLHHSRLALGSLVFDKDSHHITSLATEIDKNIQQAADHMMALQKLTSDVVEIQTLLAQMNNTFIQWNQSNQTILSLAKSNQYADALITFVGINQSQFNKLRGLYDLAGQLTFYYSAQQLQKIKRYAASFQIIIASLTIVAFLLSLLLARLAPRHIPLATTARHAKPLLAESQAEHNQAIRVTKGHPLDNLASGRTAKQNEKIVASQAITTSAEPAKSTNQ